MTPCAKLMVMGLLTALLACSKADEDADLLPPPDSSVHALQPIVDPRGAHARFGAGWFPIETNAEQAWRWMGSEADITVTTQPSPPLAHVKIAGWVPSDLHAPSTIEVKVNHVLLDSFVAPKERFTREYDVSTKAGEAALTLSASATVHPPGDGRDLGFALVSFSWTYP